MPSSSTVAFAFVIFLGLLASTDALFSRGAARRVSAPKQRGPTRFNALPLVASTDFETVRLAAPVADGDHIAQALHAGAFTLECALDAYRPWRTLRSFKRADSRTSALSRLKNILGGGRAGAQRSLANTEHL